jgi:hypothetical protein
MIGPLVSECMGMDALEDLSIDRRGQAEQPGRIEMQ